MVGPRILFSGINLLARWHKENPVETIFVECLLSARHARGFRHSSLNPYLQAREVGSRLIPLTEGVAEGQRVSIS